MKGRSSNKARILSLNKAISLFHFIFKTSCVALGCASRNDSSASEIRTMTTDNG